MSPWLALDASLSLPCSAGLGDGGGLGVGARDDHGDKLERKPCLLSGAAILSKGLLPLSQDWLRRGSWRAARDGGRALGKRRRSVVAVARTEGRQPQAAALAGH